MHRITFDKVEANAALIKRVHRRKDQYQEVIELLDEPYKLALEILNHPALSDRELGKKLSRNWQTIKQMRRALNV